MFGHLGCISPPGIIAAPSNTTTARGIVWAPPEPLAFAKPFPIKLQQFAPNSGRPSINSWF